MRGVRHHYATSGDAICWLRGHCVFSLARAHSATKLGYGDDAAHYAALSARTAGYYSALWYHANGSFPYFQDGYPISQVLALQGGFAGDNATAVFGTLLGLIASGKFSGLPNSPTGGIVFMKVRRITRGSITL